MKKVLNPQFVVVADAFDCSSDGILEAIEERKHSPFASGTGKDKKTCLILENFSKVLIYIERDKYFDSIFLSNLQISQQKDCTKH